MPADQPVTVPAGIICQAPRAVDGDTIRCANLSVRVRLIGIDAPELPGHCRKGRRCTPGDGRRARQALQQLLFSGPVEISVRGRDRYGRLLARVTITTRAGRLDANCQMIASGHAVPRYSPLRC
jgi:endonuclease YncB( thermonuclease family)